ncbi:preprotein translocase subunit YajC [soil metagenome]
MPAYRYEVLFPVKDLAGFLPFVLIALVFWFLIVRPQRRRQQDLASTQSSLDVGTEVMLGSGIFGTVASLDDETLRLEIAPGTTVKVARQAVAKVLSTPVEDLYDDLQHDTEPDSGPADPDADQRP